MEKIAFCIPWDSPMVWTQSMVSIMNIRVPDWMRAKYFNGKGFCAAQRHNTALNAALDWGARYIFFVGADQLFDENCLVSLCNHIDYYDMVSGVVPTRGVVEGRAFQAAGFIRDGDGWKVVTENDPPQRIDTTGTGILLVRSNVFRKLKRPYFTEALDKNSDNFARVGPCDARTVGTLVEQGCSLFLDTTVRAIHLDVFHIDFSFGERFSDKPDGWVPAKG